MSFSRSVGTTLVAAIAIAVASCVDTPAITSATDLTESSSVGRITVEPSNLSIAPGSDAPLDVQLEDTDGNLIDDQPIVWVSSDSSVATVSASGVVSAHRPGTANIIAMAGTQSAQAVVDVSEEPASRKPTVAVTPSTVGVVAKATVTLVASVVDTAGKKVTAPSVSWSSASAAIATVTQAGVVTGVAPGTVKITASSGGGSASSLVTVTAAPPAPPGGSSSGVGSLYTGYSAGSPHWSHIRTLATDFYYNWTPTERTWAGQHFDVALSGGGAAWRAVNPGVTHLPYTLFWTVLTPSSSSKQSISSIYYDDMEQWYASRPEYRMEDAFLHTSTDKSINTRAKVMIWDSDRWLINPADPGARAYTIDRYRRIVADEEGVFIDEASSGDILPRARLGVDISATEYQAAFTSLLADIKKAFGSKMIMLNTAEYTKDFDRANAAAAGAVHLELFNNPMYSEMPLRWKWIEELRSLGVTVDLVSPYPSKWADDHASQYPKGNYPTSGQRIHMWELASYYMVVGQSPEGLFYHIKAPDWETPFANYWFKGIEANIGHPLGARRVLQQGTDPVGQAYAVYEREFDRALVLIRSQRGWDKQSYLDATAVEVTLPSGESWLPLRADGTLGAAVAKVKLRNSESLILVKKSRI
jgi:hypothetical protein